MHIGSAKIGSDSLTFVIAEFGLDHNESPTLAKKLVELAFWSGGNCAKFQIQNLSELYRNSSEPNDIREDVTAQYIQETFARHLHIVDAAGVDGEGLQIGKGVVGFPELARTLTSVDPKPVSYRRFGRDTEAVVSNSAWP